jgi:hypothetical protein
MAVSLRTFNSTTKKASSLQQVTTEQSVFGGYGTRKKSLTLFAQESTVIYFWKNGRKSTEIHPANQIKGAEEPRKRQTLNERTPFYWLPAGIRSG